jgi:radical SAM/Cys-rich protein
MTFSLRKRGHPLADPQAQRRRLEASGHDFDAHLARHGLAAPRARGLTTLQINVGRRCNQACAHCHVDAGPERDEVMGDAVLDACLGLLVEGGIPTLDITGGAPELHPRFREMVERARTAGRHVIHRCNLTALLLPGREDLASFLADHAVEIIASLPYWLPRRTDAQRGAGVFDRSVEALRRLNDLGYGREDGPLRLNLVTNPVGAFLPAPQAALQRDWKRELDRRYGLRFHCLYTITNMPISRFLEWLEESGNLAGYMERLSRAFNPDAAGEVMCRDLVSVGWDGTLYDCDFNQMLEMPVGGDGRPRNVLSSGPEELLSVLGGREVRTGAHCLGCTAGGGSSCGGATI